jgi:hypothetical protein
MAQQKVELRKIRDFSDNLNDTFLFIKQNLKPLLTSFLGIAGVFMLVAAVLQGLSQNEVGNFFEEIFKGGSSRNVTSPFDFLNQYYFLGIFASIGTVVAMQVAIVGYVKVYENNPEQMPEIGEVWEVFKKYFLPVLVYSIPLLILTLLGTALCLAPGVYFAVVFMIFPVVIIMEDETFGGAFNRCFTLIKENFWTSLGIYIVVYLIYAFSSGIISTIVGLVTGLLSYFTTNDVSTTMAIVTSVLNIFTFVFYVVFYISVILNYFTLTEKYDGTGMMRRLDSLGGSTTNNNTEEEY